MPDYKAMYLTMVRESEKALRIIIDAQRKCEEIYMSATDEDALSSDEGITAPAEADKQA